MFKEIKTILPQALAKNGLKQKLQAKAALQIFIKVVAELINKSLVYKVKPISLSAGVLNVAVISEITATQLKNKEAEIIFRLNQEIGDNIVNKISYII